MIQSEIRRAVLPAFSCAEICLLLFFATLFSASATIAQPPDPETELIVLLRAGEAHPTAEEVVESFDEGRGAVLGGLDIGDPIAVRFAITRRARGEIREWNIENPDTSPARLQRYVVFTYAESSNRDATMAQLEQNDHVEHVEKNLVVTLSSTTSSTTRSGPTSDPLTDPAVSGDGYQWHVPLLRLPEAWEHARGHALVASIDRGVQADHPDLRPFRRDVTGRLVYEGGNYRDHLSEDVFFDDCNPDELDPGDGIARTLVGHGVHVAGLMTSTTDNGRGVAAVCPGCSLATVKAVDTTGNSDAQGSMTRVSRAIVSLTDQGVQLVNLSLGIAQTPCSLAPVNLSVVCTSLAYAMERDVVIVASSGNNRGSVEFPANDPRVLAVGGVARSAGPSGWVFWDDCPSGNPAAPDCRCPFRNDPNLECGSNFGPEQDLVAPAKAVISTMYEGFDHNTSVSCGDSFLPDWLGYGPCTGTSMSAPQVTGIAGLVRSVNPLLDREDVRDVLVTTASRATSRTDRLGYGLPDAGAAVSRAKGLTGGEPIANRLTPYFSLYSSKVQDHVYTTSPTFASSLIFDENVYLYAAVGPRVSEYPNFPDARCVISPCEPKPAASLYVLTSDREPFPGAPPLVPLYRMRYDPNLPFRCDESEPPPILNRDFTLTTSEAGILHHKESLVDSNGLGYELDGIDGWIFERCEPEPACIPEGAERVYRYYNGHRDDFAIFPESELPQKQAEGYGPTGGELAPIIGYAYPNVDSDDDLLIDGFEWILGTDPQVADTDCDGVTDGEEVHFYDRSNPDPTKRGYGDPLDGSCTDIFADGFESGDSSQWSTVESGS